MWSMTEGAQRVSNVAVLLHFIPRAIFASGLKARRYSPTQRLGNLSKKHIYSHTSPILTFLASPNPALLGSALCKTAKFRIARHENALCVSVRISNTCISCHRYQHSATHTNSLSLSLPFLLSQASWLASVCVVPWAGLNHKNSVNYSWLHTVLYLRELAGPVTVEPWLKGHSQSDQTHWGSWRRIFHRLQNMYAV